MTQQEICKEYRESKSKKRQIAILADENLCTKSEIIKILVENGEKVETKTPGRPKKQESQEVKEPERQQAEEKPKNIMPDSVQIALFARLDAIESEIREKEKEYREIVDFLNMGSSQEA